MPRRLLDLNGDEWRLGRAPDGAPPDRPAWDELERVAEWQPATVPGNIRADLIRAGHLPDLSFGMQAEAAQWVDDHCWWLLREFDLPPSPGERVHLVLRGVGMDTRTIVLTTHDMERGLLVGRRMAILVQGKVVYEMDQTDWDPDRFRQTYTEQTASDGLAA